jgi:hypothetical protein
MSKWSRRLAPLTGVVFVVLFVIGYIQLNDGTPSTDASGAKVISYYNAHNQGGIGFTLLLSMVFGLFFFGILRSYLRRAPRAEWLSAVALSGAVVFTIGIAVDAGTAYALSDVPTRLSSGAAQALNVLSSDLSMWFYPAGLCVFMLAFGLAILRSGLFPRWLGWVTAVIGVAAVLGPLIEPAFYLTGVWILVVSVWLFQRSAAVALTDGTSPSGASPA